MDKLHHISLLLEKNQTSLNLMLVIDTINTMYHNKVQYLIVQREFAKLRKHNYI